MWHDGIRVLGAIRNSVLYSVVNRRVIMWHGGITVIGAAKIVCYIALVIGE
jgi:hypothetical protein